ncbi:MAG TPA: response regulator transcription factor [Candidatus Limnocylindrales bacterium]|nr:response regulator transcription factor [Candidatus Limnocylindrales bacterium]
MLRKVADGGKHAVLELNHPLRILVAAGSPLARAGLAALLGDVPGMDVTGQVALEDGLDSAIDLHLPDLVVCDLGYDPLRAAEHLADIDDGPAILVLVVDATSAAEAAHALLGAGVRGVLAQDSGRDVLVAAIGAISHGMMVFGPEMARVLLPRASATAAHEAALHAGFTPREQEVLALVAEGLPNKQIARQLHISEHTVKFHINALLTKLGAGSRTEAVVRASRLGLIAL